MGVSGQHHAPAALYPQGKDPWVGPRAGLDTEDIGKIICPRRGSNPDRPVVQPVVRHYTAWATPAPRVTIIEINFIQTNYGIEDCKCCLCTTNHIVELRFSCERSDFAIKAGCFQHVLIPSLDICVTLLVFTPISFALVLWPFYVEMRCLLFTPLHWSDGCGDVLVRQWKKILNHFKIGQEHFLR
jgi:hypothetical protein